jgi:hypothetical protein
MSKADNPPGVGMEGRASRSQMGGAGPSDHAAGLNAEPSAEFTPVGFILEGEDWEPGEIAFIVKGPIGRGYTIDDLTAVCAALSDAAPQARTHTASRDESK